MNIIIIWFYRLSLNLSFTCAHTIHFIYLSNSEAILIIFIVVTVIVYAFFSLLLRAKKLFPKNFWATQNTSACQKISQEKNYVLAQAFNNHVRCRFSLVSLVACGEEMGPKTRIDSTFFQKAFHKIYMHEKRIRQVVYRNSSLSSFHCRQC